MKAEILSDVSDYRGDNFRAAMRELASGVSIIAAGAEGDRAGITVTSVTSLTVNPPTALVCISLQASIHPVLKRYWHFSANFLTADQELLARRFSGQTGVKGAARFDEGDWITLATGAPVLADSIASIDCKIEEFIDRHSHSVVLGRVLGVRVGRRGAGALVHWRSRFSAYEAWKNQP